MAGIIICEGKTDAVLISYYLFKVCDYKYSKNKLVEIPIRNTNNEICNWFTKENNTKLAIWGIGGKSNIEYAAEQIIQLNSIQFTFDKIAIVRDRDDEEELEILDDLRHFFNIPSDMYLTNNSWSELVMDDAFGVQNRLKILPLIIPFTVDGSLETFLLNALSEDSNKKYIVDQSIKFVDELESVESILSTRLKLKAKLSVTLSIISPDKVFTLLDDLLKEVPWENYKNIRASFACLDEI